MQFGGFYLQIIRWWLEIAAANSKKFIGNKPDNNLVSAKRLGVFFVTSF